MSLKISVIGTGYVGLVSGVCFADLGHQVCCLDIDTNKITRLNEGDPIIFEPGLAALMTRTKQEGQLTFSDDIRTNLAASDIALIAVGTPTSESSGAADLSAVEAVAQVIAETVRPGTVVILKSTVPVGTNRWVQSLISELRGKNDVTVISNPEFLREGQALKDFQSPDRIVIGLNDDKENNSALQTMRAVYANYISYDIPYIEVVWESAEMIKYAANAFLATKITFINEVASLCEQTSADVDDVARGIGLDKRIGAQFLRAGPGFGGSCFPKDTAALLHTSQISQSPMRLIEAVIEVNESRKTAMASKIIKAAGGSVDGKKIAIWGLAFKAQTDDIRDSPAIPIIEALLGKGADIYAFDPEAIENAKETLSAKVVFCASWEAAASQADLITIVTDWEDIVRLDLESICDNMNNPIIVDLRNQLLSADVVPVNCQYTSVGR